MENWNPPEVTVDGEIQELLQKLCDVQLYRDEFQTLGFNNEFFKFDHLPKNDIREALSNLLDISEFLSEIRNVGGDMEKVQELKEKIASKSNRFYELIPQNQY